MEKNKIIIIALILVIIILVAVLVTMPKFAKTDSKLEITSNETLIEGDSLAVKLTDANGTALANQTVNVTITDKNKTKDYHSVVTGEDGVGSLKLEKSADVYEVFVNYSGNDNYNGCNSTQKLTIEQEVQETASESSDSSGWTETSPGGDTGSSIVVYHDGHGHKYVTRYSADGSFSEDGIAYDEDAPITS